MADDNNPWGLTVETVGIRETSPGTWRLTFDGRVLGDSRGYDKHRAIEEACRTVTRSPQYHRLDDSLFP